MGLSSFDCTECGQWDEVRAADPLTCGLAIDSHWPDGSRRAFHYPDGMVEMPDGTIRGQLCRRCVAKFVAKGAREFVTEYTTTSRRIYK